jgi:hypothetical protein
MEQLEIWPIESTTLTVSQAFDLFWKIHFQNKPSGKTYLSNRKALCRSFGEKRLRDLSSVGTTEEHYIVSVNEDTRDLVNHIERIYRV